MAKGEKQQKQSKKKAGEGSAGKKHDSGENAGDNIFSKYFFKSFDVLGELADERIAIWSKVNRKIYRVQIKDLSLDKLDQIGGSEVISRVSRQKHDDKISFRQLKRFLIFQASKKQLGQPELLGQGIHFLPDNRLLILSGGESWIWDGIRFCIQESPLVNRQFINWEPGKEWINLRPLMAFINGETV